MLRRARPFGLLHATLLAALSGSTWLLAQAPEQPPPPDPAQQPIFRATVNLVRVDVSVTDRSGEPIENLQPSDFIVKEDGVAQTVETVQFVQLTGNTPVDHRESIAIRSASHAAAEAARDDVRLFVLFLDDYHVDKTPHIMVPLRKTLRAFVDLLGPYDLVAVVDPLTPLSHIGFTRDRNELLDRVQRFEGRRGELFPVRSAAEEMQQTQRNVWELRAGVTLDALNAVAIHLGGLREGRKSILFVSQGPPVSLRSSNWQRLEDLVRSANRGNVTIHTLDPRPLGASEFGGNMVLRRLADESGGRAIHNTNDHAEHLDGVIADASAYYLIGYAPERELADGKFHKIEVDVKRRGVRVVARRGYWAPRAEELNAAPAPVVAPAVTEAIATLTEPVSGRTADVWIGFSRGSDALTDVTVTWDPTARLDATAAARIEVEHLRNDGSVEGAVQSVPRREAGGRAEAARFALNPGRTVLRFTSFDASDNVLDRWPEDVAVPDIGSVPLALATPRLLLARSAFELRALQAATEVTPTASRRFRKSDRLLVEIEHYATGPSPEIVTELLNQRGEPLVTLPVPESERGAVRIELPLQSLAPALYILRVRAQTLEHRAEQHVPFRIVG